MWKLTKQYFIDVWTYLWSKTTVDEIIIAKAEEIKAKAEKINDIINE
jgi:hypothetical protein|tara:strand:+ start:29 stop:169 length:141 start_codon:yes stop_codon:yes gene_type:complete